MRVTPEPLKGSAMVALVAMETRPMLDIYEGEVLGYWCAQCAQSDETLEQVIHREDCTLAGRHGRRVYGGSLEGVLDTASAGELRPDTTFTMLRWGVTDEGLRIYNGTAVAYRCDECGNLDEHLFEIVHDVACWLAGREFGPPIATE